jgi:hypothetical protein
VLDFAYKGIYESNVDAECIPLLNALNSLPGVDTSCSRKGTKDKSFSIFFKCNNDLSLRFLGRCIDSRYWKYGASWEIRLSNSDTNYNSSVFELHSCSSSQWIKTIGDDANNEALDLVENMKWHLNCKAYMDSFILSSVIGFDGFNLTDNGV